MVHPPSGSRSVHLLGHQRRRNGETSIRPSRGRIRNHDGLASRVSGGSLPRSPGAGLRQTLRFLGPLQRNVPRGLPWTRFPSPFLRIVLKTLLILVLIILLTSTFPPLRLGQILRPS